MPSPLKVNDDVWSWDCSGNRKTKLQLLPESDWGMSKLKIDETCEDTTPLNLVPPAVSGELESIGTIKCGNSKLPAVRVVGQLLLDEEVDVPEVEVDVAEVDPEVDPEVELKHESACNSTLVHMPRSKGSAVWMF